MNAPAHLHHLTDHERTKVDGTRDRVGITQTTPRYRRRWRRGVRAGAHSAGPRSRPGEAPSARGGVHQVRQQGDLYGMAVAGHLSSPLQLMRLSDRGAPNCSTKDSTAPAGSARSRSAPDAELRRPARRRRIPPLRSKPDGLRSGSCCSATSADITTRPTPGSLSPQWRPCTARAPDTTVTIPACP